MVENKLEYDILRLYQDNLVNLYSINQIAKKLSKKYPYVNKKVSGLIASGILKKIVIGRSYLCSLNLDNPKTILKLALAELDEQGKIPGLEKIKNRIMGLLPKTTILIVVYYKKRQVFVVDNIRDRRDIVAEFADALVLDRRQFIDLMIDDRELFFDHVVVYGFEKFFELLAFDLDEIKRKYSPLRY